MVAPDRSVSTIELGGPDDGLAAMQQAVGGYVEMLAVPLYPPLLLWANEDGRSLGLPLNPWATMFMGEPIVGSVIITGGSTDGDGGLLPIPEIWARWLPH